MAGRGAEPEHAVSEAGAGRADVRAPTRSARGAVPAGAAHALTLQRSAGNRAVGALLSQASSTRPAPIPLQRDGASAAPSTTAAPPASGGPPQHLANNGVKYQGRTLFPDIDLCTKALDQMLPEKGFQATSSYGHSFLSLDFESRAESALFADDAYVSRTQDAMRSAVTAFDERCRIFLERFEMTAGNLTDAMLTNAEQQIHGEQQKLGMTSTSVGQFNIFGGGGPVLTDYSVGHAGYLQEAKAEAGRLGARRAEVDALRRTSADAKKKLDDASAFTPGKEQDAPAPSTTPFGMTPSSNGGLPAFVPQSVIDQQRSTYTTWQTAEEDFGTRASASTAQYPSIAPLLAGGGDVAARLTAFSTQSDKAAGQSLGEQFAQKLDNIATVRSELGKRFTVWKQAPVLAVTHQQMGSGPGEQRLVRDKAAQVQEEKANSEKMYAAVALGLGLLAAIPTGGSSILAGVALAASVTGAAMSAYNAYDQAQEYMLQKATANTSLTRALQISESEPSLLYLALDIAASIADLAAAKAAFTVLHETIAAAKAAKAAEAMSRLPELLRTMRQYSIGPAGVGRVLEEVLPVGGDVGKALHEIRQVFVKVGAEAEDKALGELLRDVGQKAINDRKVLVVPNESKAAIASLEDQLARRGGPYADREFAKETARSFHDTLFLGDGTTAHGFYDPVEKLIVLRGSLSAEGAAAALTHEATHLAQASQKLKAIGVFSSELEAYTAQQQFLQLLPADRVPEDMRWLVGASVDDMGKHIVQAYGKWGAEYAATTHDQVLTELYVRLFAAGQ